MKVTPKKYRDLAMIAETGMPRLTVMGHFDGRTSRAAYEDAYRELLVLHRNANDVLFDSTCLRGTVQRLIFATKMDAATRAVESGYSSAEWNAFVSADLFAALSSAEELLK